MHFELYPDHLVEQFVFKFKGFHSLDAATHVHNSLDSATMAFVLSATITRRIRRMSASLGLRPPGEPLTRLTHAKHLNSQIGHSQAVDYQEFH